MAEVAPAPSSQLVTHRYNPTKYLTITLPLRRSIYSPPSSATFPQDSNWPSKEYSRTDSELLQKPRYLGPSYTTYSPPNTSVVDRFGREDQDRGQQNNVSPSMLLSSPSSSFISATRGLPPIIPMDAPMQGYEQRPSSPRTLPSGYADSSMEMGGPSDLAPRKRSKVSRACDECRRKKIRCDATSETGVEQCSSCKRVGARCSFSRVPMKRGPSKGYIKELADRLNTLENTISTSDMHPYSNLTSVEGESSPMDSEGTSPPPNISMRQSRKRTLSSSSEFPLGMHLQPLAQSPTLQRSGERLPPIDSFHSPHHQSAPPQIPQRQLPPPHIPPSHSSSGLHSQRGSISSASVPPPLIAHTSPTSGLSTCWRPDSREARRQSLSGPLEPIDIAMSSNMMKNAGKSFDWDEPTIDQYYSIIHPTFPFLPHSKARLRLRLSHASARVREALLQALYCAVRSNPASTLIPTGPFESRGVAELAFAAQYEDPSSRSIADNLVYLQTLIFLILEADNRGPAAVKGQFGPPRALWLGAAIGLAYNLRLHYGSSGLKSSDSDNDDSDEKLGRRAWWTLVVLDRWNAVSTSSPLHIPDSSVVLLQEDQSLLGIAAYQITRLSMILGHLAENLTSSDQAVSTSVSSAYVSRLLRGELERFRESVDSVLGSLNLVHIAYWHVKLLFLRLNDATEPNQLIGPATRIAVILNSGQAPVTPLSYHFAALAILTLVDLLEFNETRIEAEKGVMLIAESLEKRRGVSTREDSTGWDRTIKDFISRRTSRTNSGGTTNAGKHPLPHGKLQHLAELAVGESAGGGGPGASGMSPESRNLVIDAHMLQKYGYLGCLVL